MYCSAFRRLSSKTQVFNSQKADNLRTRLTHTLEVAQVARTISCQLGLDEELTEAIALGHDVGHTPFGHVGERTLNEFSRGLDKRQIADKISVDKLHYGFKHNLQGVRVLTEYSENVKFSNFMLFGVREHSKLWWKSADDVAYYQMYEPYCSYSDGNNLFPAWSFEAFVVKWADEIAQRHHDIEDAFLQKIIPPEDIVAKVAPLVKIIDDENITRKYDRLKTETEKLARKDFTDVQYAFAHTLSSFLVDAYVTVLIKEFSRVFRHFSNTHKIVDSESFDKSYLGLDIEEIRTPMKFSDARIYKIDQQLGESLKHSILDSYEVQRMDGKGAYIIRKLFRAYLSNPQQLPNEYVNRFIKIELGRTLDDDKFEQLKSILRRELKDSYTENINVWKDYECREVLRIISKNDELSRMTYDALIRVIFDYIAGMTDSYAASQRIDLY
ncbi:dNTP triphosphohydrolase [Clostridiaceae bacterium]|nr:dNTP triphosphohydrolase [Clostridiaceae bacterium]